MTHLLLCLIFAHSCFSALHFTIYHHYPLPPNPFLQIWKKGIIYGIYKVSEEEHLKRNEMDAVCQFINNVHLIQTWSMCFKDFLRPFWNANSESSKELWEKSQQQSRSRSSTGAYNGAINPGDVEYLPCLTFCTTLAFFQVSHACKEKWARISPHWFTANCLTCAVYFTSPTDSEVIWDREQRWMRLRESDWMDGISSM